jgi:hypothetical protein
MDVQNRSLSKVGLDSLHLIHDDGDVQNKQGLCVRAGVQNEQGVCVWGMASPPAAAGTAPGTRTARRAGRAAAPSPPARPRAAPRPPGAPPRVRPRAPRPAVRSGPTGSNATTMLSPASTLVCGPGENTHRYPTSLTSLECQVSELANSDTCPRPTAPGSPGS